MQKIAILGGGIAGLTTAFELTNAPNWKDNYDITIYQLGWRVGSKGASGRNARVSGRIQEHGLHIWMGFYEATLNRFRRLNASAITSTFNDSETANLRESRKSTLNRPGRTKALRPRLPMQPRNAAPAPSPLFRSDT